MPTPSPAIPVFTSDVMVTQTQLNGVGANLTNLYGYTMGGFRTQKPLAAVRATTQSIPGTGVDTQISFDTLDFQYDTMWSSGTNNVLTVQTAGVYRIHFNAGHAGAAGFSFRAYICINGTSTSTNAVGAVILSNSNMAPCSCLVGLAAGATIYGFINQNTGSSATVDTADGGCRMTAEWVSP